MHWTIVFLLMFTLCPVVEARLPSSVGSFQASGVAILTFIKFVIPPLAKDKWTEYNKDLNLILQPIHNALSSDLIDPKTAGDQIAKTTQDFLLSKPEFESSSNEPYHSHPSKLVEKAKSVKNNYRKSMKNSDNEEDRQLFYDALRAHNKLVKSKRAKDKAKTVSYQEKLFRQNFWDFSKKVANGQYGSEPTLPTFSKDAADKYFGPKYSTATPVDEARLSHNPGQELWILTRTLRNILRCSQKAALPAPHPCHPVQQTPQTPGSSPLMEYK